MHFLGQQIDEIAKCVLSFEFTAASNPMQKTESAQYNDKHKNRSVPTNRCLSEIDTWMPLIVCLPSEDHVELFLQRKGRDPVLTVMASAGLQVLDA